MTRRNTGGMNRRAGGRGRRRTACSYDRAEIGHCNLAVQCALQAPGLPCHQPNGFLSLKHVGRNRGATIARGSCLTPKAVGR